MGTRKVAVSGRLHGCVQGVKFVLSLGLLMMLGGASLQGLALASEAEDDQALLDRLSDRLKIVGGSSVGASDAVAKVTAALESKQGWICTGTLIASDLLVTAAHCVEGSPSSLLVTFALNVDSPSAVRRQVLGYQTPPSWANAATGADHGDIALVRFGGGLPKGYKVASLLPVSQKLAKGQSVLLAGYGVTGMAPALGSGVLRKVSVNIAGSLGKTEVVLDQTQGRGACHGDSGGPAFVMSGSSLLVWGVTSRGYPDFAPDDCKQKAVYTNMNAYRAWLTSSAEALRR